MLTSVVEGFSRFKEKCDVGAEKGRVLPGTGKHAFAAPLLRGKQTVRPRYKAK
jgi:hypothetical protein